MPATHRQLAPFGNPDGSRADIVDILQGFVHFGSAAWGGLATPQDDLSARVLVGRKGSGKTVYLRRLQSYASDDASLYADVIQQGLPTTAAIVKFCQWFPENVLTERWMELWSRAVLRATVSHLLHSRRLRSLIDDEVIAKLAADYFTPLIRNFHSALSVYSQITEIIEAPRAAHELVLFLQDPRWAELEYILADALKTCPPLFFFIDAVDEEFSHAPMYWLRCQKGLFYQTMRFLRDSRLGGRLHIIICIRDVVLASVYKSEHQTRYRGEPHIRILNWNKDACGYFLRRKIEMLDSALFTRSVRDGKTLEAWLGTDSISNSERGIIEPVEQYLLRHTRLLPRDVVIMGNLLCQALARHRTNRPEETFDTVIRRSVGAAAKIFGNEQLAICANHILSNSMPKHAAIHGYSEVYTGAGEHLHGLADELKSLISSIGKDRFPRGELEAGRNLASSLLPDGGDPFSALWQNGLLGYVESATRTPRIVFFDEDNMDDFNLPRDKETYVFHSCLIDSVGIQPVGSEPVIPF